MKKRIFSLLLTAVMCLSLCPAVFAAGGFQDVSADAWYYADVNKAAELGLMNGKGDNLFAPGDLMSEAEALTLAVRMHQSFYPGTEDGKPEPIEAQAGQRWWEPYFEYAVDHDILEHQDWDQDVFYEFYESAATRRNYVQLFHKVLTPLMEAPINTIEDGAIPDVGINDEGADAIYAFYRAGILAGTDARGYFNADSYISRAEVATILVRIMDDSARKHFSLGSGLAGLRSVCKENGKDCAVAFLGSDLDSEMSREVYRQDIDFLGQAAVVDQPGYQTYLIVPADASASVLVYECTLDPDTLYEVAGELLFTGEAGQPVIVHCNVSDELSNVRVMIEGSEGGVLCEFSPSLSLRDGRLMEEDGVYDYTNYGVG